MSCCPSRRPSPRTAHRDRLAALAHLLAVGDDEVVGEAAEPHTAFAVGVSDPPDDPRRGRLHLQPLVGDPVEAMVGFVAPSEWWAFGVVAPVTLHALGDGTDASDVRPGRRLAHLVSRHGSTCSVAVGPEGVDVVQGPRASAFEGRIPDACRRVLGLATAPPTVSTGAFFVTRWLDDALERALAGDDLPDVDDLAAAAAEFTRRWSWERLRRACAAGQEPVHGMTAEEAAWWDEGGFSRRAFEGYLAASTMLDVLHELRPAWLTQTLRAGDRPANS